MDINLGKAFEISVADILRLSGYKVEMEKYIGHKKVDLYLEERRIGSKQRIAIECKKYSHRLTKEETVEIYMDYRTLYQSNLIDEVLIVTSNGLSPAAITMVDETRELSHATFSELSNNVMDFTQYIDFQINQYNDSGLINYYVPPKTSEGIDLETEINRWLDEEDFKPVAILASYGMGKTTFCQHLSYKLCLNIKENINNRIPIVIKLGQISSNQDIEGLLGKTFTTTSVVKNYSFDLFMKFNQLGHFVIFLDGFDEMKHSLSWEEFKFNFKQLLRLVDEKSKVVLLGRPTAFLNDDEYQFVLHGLRFYHGKIINESNWPDFSEYHIAPFNKEQVENFLHNYLSFKISAEKKEHLSEDYYQLQIPRILDKKMSDITRRPVQLKMLADVIPQWEGDLDNLTITILYSLFIDLIIERDQEKIARRKFNLPQRKEFAKRLAIWLWINKSEMCITPDSIPESILLPFVESEFDDLEAIKRDLISACFLERKLGESLYFPHRSFQEYLVAETILDDMTSGIADLSVINERVNDEISMFLEGLITKKSLILWEKKLFQYCGSLDWQFAKIYCVNSEFHDFVYSRFESIGQSWYMLFITIGMLNRKQQKKKIINFLNFLTDELKTNHGYEEDYILGFFCILCLSTLIHDNRPINDAIVCLTQKWNKQVKRPKNKKSTKKIDPNLYIRVHNLEMIFNILRKLSFSKKNNMVNLSGFYPLAYLYLKDYCMLSNWIQGSTIKISNLSLPMSVLVNHETIIFLENAQKLFGAVPGSFEIEHGKKRYISKK